MRGDLLPHDDRARDESTLLFQRLFRLPSRFVNRTEFKAFEAECVRLVSGNATATALTKAFSTLAKLSPEEKISAVLHFVDRDPKVRKRWSNGDWLALYFVQGAVR